nr:unnamed protein product [Callosobruchus analis]
MGVFIYLLFILASVHLSTAYTERVPNDPKVNNDPRYHCNTNYKGIGGLAKNQTVRINGECAEAYCDYNKEITVMGECKYSNPLCFSCSPVGVPPDCEVLPGDLNKPYPDCCHTIKCA